MWCFAHLSAVNRVLLHHDLVSDARVIENHESEATRAAGVAVVVHECLRYVAIVLKIHPELLVGGLPRQAPHKHLAVLFVAHLSSRWPATNPNPARGLLASGFGTGWGEGKPDTRPGPDQKEQNQLWFVSAPPPVLYIYIYVCIPYIHTQIYIYLYVSVSRYILIGRQGDGGLSASAHTTVHARPRANKHASRARAQQTFLFLPSPALFFSGLYVPPSPLTTPRTHCTHTVYTHTSGGALFWLGRKGCTSTRGDPRTVTAWESGIGVAGGRGGRKGAARTLCEDNALVLQARLPGRGGGV